MPIPIKCFTCGNVLANKYEPYKERIREYKIKNNESTDRIVYLTRANTTKSIEGRTLDELQLKKMCCRTIMLTHVDIN
jgi:DNA-directed RNA polymerase I, II, and III subunit RPABC5